MATDRPIRQYYIGHTNAVTGWPIVYFEPINFRSIVHSHFILNQCEHYVFICHRHYIRNDLLTYCQFVYAIYAVQFSEKNGHTLPSETTTSSSVLSYIFFFVFLFCCFVRCANIQLFVTQCISPFTFTCTQYTIQIPNIFPYSIANTT